MSSLLDISFCAEVHVELDILLNNLDDTSCGVFVRYNRGFTSSAMCLFVAGCFPTFRTNVSPFSSGFQVPWRMTYTVNSKLAVDFA